jgi:hypothetical protein
VHSTEARGNGKNLLALKQSVEAFRIKTDIQRQRYTKAEAKAEEI